MTARRIQISHRLFAAGLSGALFLVAGAAWGGNVDSTLYSFRGGNDGNTPWSKLASDSAGNLYGTTYSGGHTDACDGCGTVFTLTPRGKERILHAFQGTDGSEPVAGVTLDGAGNIYGTAAGGGASGFGTIFKLAPDGSETVLYSFKGNSDGASPDSDLVTGPDGTLYGTTSGGGGSPNCQNGCGTVFKLTPDGQESLLYAFQGGSDGWSPHGGLVRDNDGNFYGTTQYGGGSTACNDFGCGTVFKIAPDGIETVLYSFGTDSVIPLGGVILDESGNLYGTTLAGGVAGAGTVFRLAPDGTKTILYSFKGGHDDGAPLAGVVRDKKGNLYGTTSSGGGTQGCHGFGCGTLFKLTPKGKESILLSFNKRNGRGAAASLLLGKHGELYGTTPYGGEHKKGVVFQVKK